MPGRRSTLLACAAITLGAAAAVVVVRRDDHREGDRTLTVAATTVPASTSTSPPPLTSTSPSATASPSTTTAPVAVAVTVPATAPAATTVAPAVIDPACPPTGHGAVVDRDAQRGTLCDAGVAVHEFPITSAWTEPDPGTYPVYAKDMNSTSNFGGHFSRMTHFVAFTRGDRTGARIAFHSVPTFSNGSFVQPLDSVGQADRRGDSSGCVRVLPDDAVLIWDWLAIGDEVHVVS